MQFKHNWSKPSQRKLPPRVAGRPWLWGSRKRAAWSSSTPIIACVRCCRYMSATLGDSVPVMPL